MPLSEYPDSQPDTNLDVVFLHHSVGGQLLADPGPTRDLADSVHLSHPNGGGLRQLLSAHGYAVNEASYGSAVGQDTDLFDWLPKFASKMDLILRTRLNDAALRDASNQVVLFKSCYPNNRFVGRGAPPGDPNGPALTVWNAKASFVELLEHFRRRPDVLFIYLTAPPEAPAPSAPSPMSVGRRARQLVKAALGRPSAAEVLGERARLAREFNSWVAARDGWLADYAPKNVAVFDYYDALTQRRSNLSAYPSGDGSDSHPRAEGQQLAAKALVPFINRAVRRAGLST